MTFKLFGVPVKLHWSILIPFAFTLNSLESTLTLAALYVCVLIHEFGHVAMAQNWGINCSRITLLCFGGAAELDEEPRTPAEEFSIAFAGPVVSAILTAIGFGACLFVYGEPNSVPHWMLVFTLINGMILVFNMIPAFPMDGGRILRSFLWYVSSYRTATRISVVLSVLLSGVGVVAAAQYGNWSLGLISVVVGLLAMSYWNQEKT